LQRALPTARVRANGTTVPRNRATGPAPFRPRMTYDPKPRESPTTPLLSVTRVTKHFGGVEALTGCTLSVHEGSITGLIGPNGARKTALFNVISGLTPPDGGEIRLGDDRLDGLSAHAIARRGVARTFQIPRPLGRMTVLENVLLYGKSHPGEALRHVFSSPARV